VTAELVRRVLDEERSKLVDGDSGDGDQAGFAEARRLFEEVALADEFVES
jgi:malate synthase